MLVIRETKEMQATASNWERELSYIDLSDRTKVHVVCPNLMG